MRQSFGGPRVRLVTALCTAALSFLGATSVAIVAEQDSAGPPSVDGLRGGGEIRDVEGPPGSQAPATG